MSGKTDGNCRTKACSIAIAAFAACVLAGCWGAKARVDLPADPNPVEVRAPAFTEDADPRLTEIFDIAEGLRRGDPSTWSPNRLERAVAMYDSVAEPDATARYHPKAPDALYAGGTILRSLGRDLEAAGRLHAAYLLAPERLQDAAVQAVEAYVRAGKPDRAGAFVAAVEASAQTDADRRFAASLRERMKLTK